MQQKDYEFSGVWQPYPQTGPSNATRCLVTDGDIVVIATYLTDNKETSAWMFQGLNDNGASFKVIGWMPLPRPMPKPVSEEPKKDEKITDTSMVGG